MESCNICCFPYSDENSEGSSRAQKSLSCSHSLCKSCYLRLEKTHCPFCRSIFNYSTEELNERKLLNLSYHNWQPPSQISNYIPPNTQSRIRDRILTININQQNQVQNRQVQEPFSRVRKNMVRKRRKDLEFEEVLERRKIIRQRCKKKWTRKSARLEKELSCFLAGSCVS